MRDPVFETIDKVLPVAITPVAAMVEVLYRAVERGHRLPPAQLHADLLALGLTVEPVTDADSERAAELIVASKATPGPGSLPLGDGLCIAVAERLGLPLTGGDTYWSQVPLQVEYLPFRAAPARRRCATGRSVPGPAGPPALLALGSPRLAVAQPRPRPPVMQATENANRARTSAHRTGPAPKNGEAAPNTKKTAAAVQIVAPSLRVEA